MIVSGAIRDDQYDWIGDMSRRYVVLEESGDTCAEVRMVGGVCDVVRCAVGCLVV